MGSVRGSKGQVWRGTRQKTKTSGQTKSDLMMNKRGKIVSKKSHNWFTCVQEKWTCKMDQSLHASKKKSWIKRFCCMQKRNQILQRSHENLQSLIHSVGRVKITNIVFFNTKLIFLLNNRIFYC